MARKPRTFALVCKRRQTGLNRQQRRIFCFSIAHIAIRNIPTKKSGNVRQTFRKAVTYRLICTSLEQSFY